MNADLSIIRLFSSWTIYHYAVDLISEFNVSINKRFFSIIKKKLENESVLNDFHFILFDSLFYLNLTGWLGLGRLNLRAGYMRID